MIKVENLRYRYPGQDKLTIKDISFSIARGEIFGFLGPSGAGKSTTQKILIGILKDYKGIVRVNNKNISEAGGDFYNDIGVSFELPNLYSKLTGRENLEFFANLYRVPTRPAEELLALVGLEEASDKRVSDYSKGMKMRLNFCRSLVHNPAILFLDEPTSGLDPVNAKKIKDIIMELKSRGKTIFLTTHNKNVDDELCDRVAVFNEGELVLIDSPRRLKIDKGEKKVRLDFSREDSIQSQEFPLKDLGRNTAFLDLLNSENIETIHTKEASLEEIFIKVTGRRLE
jgi:fluoroquinolone transport system ATP-binding protein